MLVVDEDPGLARALQILLEEERPYSVVTASSEDDAVRSLAEHPEVTVLICDLTMPGNDKLTLLELLRAHRPDLVAVALTAHLPAARAAEATRRGPLLCVHKPVDPAELLAAIDRLTGPTVPSRARSL